MNTPPLLVGFALLFWGWQTGMLLVAVPAAVLMEASRWIKWRLDFAQDHYNRLWNLTFLLAAGMALFLFLSQGGYAAMNEFVERGQNGVRTESLKNVGNLVLRILQLLPAAFLLFMTAFAYGPVQKLPAITFSLLYRRHARSRGTLAASLGKLQVNPTYGFLVLLLLAVGASNTNPRWYFPCLAVLIAWSLWGGRATAYRPVAWASMVILACGIGFASQILLLQLQKKFEAWQNRWINRLGNASEFDTSQTRTSMGQLGKLKQSGRIVWRVHPGQSEPPPLLQEAVFNIYEQAQTKAPDGSARSPSWTTSSPRRFENSVDGTRDPIWVLNPSASPTRSVTLLGLTHNGEVNIPHPESTVVVTDLTAHILAVQTNMLGAMRAIGAQTLAVLETRYGADGGFAIGPVEEDLSLTNLAPADERAINQIAGELNLKSASPEAALGRIKLYFFNQFDYTLDDESPPAGATNNTPLAHFLLDRHKGHCEYFATATTLLLRAAGIPARYAVGFSVQEKRSNNEYLVRERHAHAWTLAWIKNRWREIDNTPAGWFEADLAEASPWEAYSDWWSDAWFAFYRWRQGDSNLRLYILIGGVLTLGYLAWRQVAGKRWRRAREARDRAARFRQQGLDSEFFKIQRLLEKDHPRETAETVSVWLKRQHFPQAELFTELPNLLNLHYRLRFDPAGLSPSDREQLRDGTTRWLERYAKGS